MSSAIPAVGEVLEGKFRIERVLGQGGMGVVVAAHHLLLDERVALKFLLSGHAMNADVVARFLREARAAAKIRSEHVARVSDVGKLADGTPFMVMEYLEGHDLAQVIRDRGPLPVAEAVDVLLQAIDGIDLAHRMGIVHRDLKPANLFRATASDGSATVKVLDFGISKLAEATGSHPLTRTAATMGSPLYMSPEQLKSARDVDARADVWALGVTLYELLTGRHPFEAEDLPRLSVQIILSPHTPLLARRTDVPPRLVAAIDRCLEKDPANRFHDVVELALELAPHGTEIGRDCARRCACRTAPTPKRDLAHATTEVAQPPSSGTGARDAPPPGGGTTARSIHSVDSVEPPAVRPPFPRRPTMAWAAVAVLGVGTTLFSLREERAAIAPRPSATVAAAPSGDAPDPAEPPASASVARAPAATAIVASTPSATVPKPDPSAPAASTRVRPPAPPTSAPRRSGAARPPAVAGPELY